MFPFASVCLSFEITHMSVLEFMIPVKKIEHLSLIRYEYNTRIRNRYVNKLFPMESQHCPLYTRMYMYTFRQKLAVKSDITDTRIERKTIILLQDKEREDL